MFHRCPIEYIDHITLAYDRIDVILLDDSQHSGNSYGACSESAHRVKAIDSERAVEALSESMVYYPDIGYKFF